MRTGWPAFGVPALVTVLAVAVIGCGGGGGVEQTPAATPTTLPGGTTTPEVTAQGTQTSEQIRAVQRLDDLAHLVQLACLDTNGDGTIDGGDTDPNALSDITGDGMVNEGDLALVRELQFTLPNGKPQGCVNGRGPGPDWQVSKPPDLNCAAGERGVLLLGVGGGAVDLAMPHNAAGARWMVEELSGKLGVPAQVASVAPGLVGTSQPQPDAEHWAFLFLSQRLREQPCLKTVILGHSHGGVLATATAARLEEAGLGRQILLTVLIDRVTYLYGGDTTSLPQSSPVFNVYLPVPGQEIAGAVIDQPNVENFDASGLQAPEQGDQGGELKPANHTTIDNSPDVLREVEQRVETALRGS